MEQLPREEEQPWAGRSSENQDLAAAIDHGLRQAKHEARPIDDLTASLAAKRLRSLFGEHQAELPALDALVVCGVVREDTVYRELYADLDHHTPEVGQLVDALYTYCIRRDDKGPVSHWGRDGAERETPSGVKPEIWIGSLSDYNVGVLHGMWMDAWQEPDELQEQVAWVLRTSPLGDAEEYAIFDHSDFCGLRIDEYMSLENVSRLAQGIAEHGEAFAAWADYLGVERLDDVERTFGYAYLGHHESMRAYVEQYLEDGDGYSFLEYVPEWLKPYVKVDTEMLARDWEGELYVTEAGDGGVFVFDTRA